MNKKAIKNSKIKKVYGKSKKEYIILSSKKIKSIVK